VVGLTEFIAEEAVLSSSKNIVDWTVAVVACSSSAAELPDCHLYKSPNYERGGTFRPRTVSRQLLLDAEAVKTGQDISYAKDDAVLNTDYKVVAHGAKLVATGDFVLKASWLTNPDFKFTKGQVITITRELVGRDGTGYPAFKPDPEWLVFLNPDGEFCNRAVMTRRGIGWNEAMGHWTRVPDDARLEWQDSDSVIESGRLRIIYMGARAGAMHFQQVLVKGSQIVSSVDRQFDQFASTIQISGLTFRVSNAKPDSVHVSYDFGPKVDLDVNGGGASTSTTADR